ncbi:hypothetical protein KAI04_04410 [Candidatus Pacearchaeota archaeon]|nr:hypothetical protein [Candidatus Pacearchaeota archaeon]
MESLKKAKCWYCGKIIENIISKHHLFNHFDIKKKLYETFKIPKTDSEHKLLHETMLLIKSNIPTFPVHLECHKEIEKKLTIIRNNQDNKIIKLQKEIVEIFKEIEELKGGKKENE